MSKLRRQIRRKSLLGDCLKMAALFVVKLGQHGNWVGLQSMFREGQRNSLLSPLVRGERGKRAIFCGKYRQKLTFD